MEHGDVVQSLKDLSHMHAAGVLSDEEFLRAKRQVIESPPASPTGAPRYGFEANVPADTVQIPLQRADGLPQYGQWGPPAGSPATFGQPPAPPPRPQHAGAIVAAIAAVLAGGSFLLLPMVSVGPFGATGSRLASLGSLPGGGGFYALWLIPAAAAVVLILAVRQLMEPPLTASGRKATLIPLIILATTTALAYLAMLVLVQERLSSAGASSIGISVLDLAGTGFWVALGSTVAAAIAGGAELGANRGMSDAMRRPIGARPRPVSVGRNVAAVATAVTIVLAMVGVAFWNVRSSPTTSAQNLTALEGQGSSSGGSQGSSLGSGGSSGSSSGQGTTPVQDAATFVENYYDLLPGNPDAAWAMLGPGAQAASGSQQAFEHFWSGISAVSLENVQTTDQSTVEATVDVTRNDGSWTREDYTFLVADSGGRQVIESSNLLHVVAAGGSSASTGTPSVGIVDLSAVSSDPRSAQIGQVLDTYFSGINQRDWSRAMSVLDPHVVDQSNSDSVARFEHGESTTNDSDVVVQSIGTSSDAPSGISATVIFQSNQDPSLGPGGESCTLWKLEYLFSGTPGTSLDIYKTKGTHTAC